MAQPTRTNSKKRICFVLDSAHLAFDDSRKRTVGGSELQVKTISEKFASLGYKYLLAAKSRLTIKLYAFSQQTPLFPS